MVVNNQKRWYVELLLYFLRNWNKTIAGFSEKHVGLPQESISDCSRLLANFYLQDYDTFMKKICDKHNTKYIRYADDQIIFSESKETADKIIFEASKFLLNQGLNFNANKAEVFDNVETYNIYWAFDIFESLDSNNEETINEAIRLFLDRVKNNVKFRKHSVLKRILSINLNNIDPKLRYEIFSLIYDNDFLSRTDYWTLNKIYKNIDDSKKQEFLIILDNLIDSIIYNSYHYNLVKFYELNKIKYDKNKIITRINKLKI